jgi:hypothetical protein
MTIGRMATLLTFLGSVLILWGCSSDKESTTGKRRGSIEDDRREIESTLAQIATRWRCGDKVALLEQEFEYAQIEYTYDQYLEIPQIKKMESDTVYTFAVKDVKYYEGDSALVNIDVVFVGPTLDTTRMPQKWVMYYDHGHWIRPTISTPTRQKEFEERRRKADSAATAEENEKW